MHILCRLGLHDLELVDAAKHERHRRWRNNRRLSADQKQILSDSPYRNDHQIGWDEESTSDDLIKFYGLKPKRLVCIRHECTAQLVEYWIPPDYSHWVWRTKFVTPVRAKLLEQRIIEAKQGCEEWHRIRAEAADAK